VCKHSIGTVHHDVSRCFTDPGEASDYAYDPRVCKIEQTYYITWCGGHIGPTISVAATKDFQRFDRLERLFRRMGSR